MELLNPKIQEYAELMTSPESMELKRLRELTFAERGDSNMLSGFYQGRLLAMFSRIVSPWRILEIGTFMGYSALCLAEGLTADGKLITLDVDKETNKIAKQFWAETKYHEKIVSYLGNAAEIIPQLEDTFDLVFIDADKANYSLYYDLVFPKTRIGGLIIADNVLWSGAVLDADSAEAKKSAKALNCYNKKIKADLRVTNILFAVRDGLMIARKEVA
ncbi:MAG: O-methyltransferase [Pyrinomonadaceae bacterium]